MKKCTKCNIEKSIESFRTRKDGYRSSWCKDCMSENCRTSLIQKQWKQNNINSIQPGVYMFTCLINNKRYVGESNKPMRRRNEHLYSITNGNNISNPEMKKDMLQYGIKNFKFEILESCNNHKEREKYWINELNPEYNICK
jgi:hypothetical protein